MLASHKVDKQLRKKSPALIRALGLKVTAPNKYLLLSMALILIKQQNNFDKD